MNKTAKVFLLWVPDRGSEFYHASFIEMMAATYATQSEVTEVYIERNMK